MNTYTFKREENFKSRLAKLNKKYENENSKKTVRTTKIKNRKVLQITSLQIKTNLKKKKAQSACANPEQSCNNKDIPIDRRKGRRPFS